MRVLTAIRGGMLRQLMELITDTAAACLNMPAGELDPDRALSSFGVDSIVGVELINRINQALGIVLKTIAIFDYPTVRQLAAHIAASASVRLAPDYQWDSVVEKVRAKLLETFGFENRTLGQPALLCEVVSVIQNTKGVAYVDVDTFGGIPEKTSDPDGTRRLLTLDELAIAAMKIVYSAYEYLFFRPEDFPKDKLSSLVKKLSSQTDSVSQFLWKKFSGQTQKLLTTPAAKPQQQFAALVEEFNKTLLGDSIYDLQRFPKAPKDVLSKDLRDLAEGNPQGGDLIRLNRLLLESAYPEIAKSPAKPQKPQPAGPVQRVEVNLADFEKGALRPAQLAIFTPAVPDTIVLNQTK